MALTLMYFLGLFPGQYALSSVTLNLSHQQLPHHLHMAFPQSVSSEKHIVCSIQTGTIAQCLEPLSCNVPLVTCVHTFGTMQIDFLDTDPMEIVNLQVIPTIPPSTHPSSFTLVVDSSSNLATSSGAGLLSVHDVNQPFQFELACVPCGMDDEFLIEIACISPSTQSPMTINSSDLPFQHILAHRVFVIITLLW